MTLHYYQAQKASNKDEKKSRNTFTSGIIVSTWVLGQCLAIFTGLNHWASLIIPNTGVLAAMLFINKKAFNKLSTTSTNRQKIKNEPIKIELLPHQVFEAKIEKQLTLILSQTEYIKNSLINNQVNQTSPIATVEDVNLAHYSSSKFLVKSKQYGLTERELDIIYLIADGLLYKEISSRLFISERTVQKHCENIFNKVAVKNRYELIKKLSQ